ncbi:MAG: exonuclease SbcCD subunit D [Clostridiales bacterium]|jgi:exonuclease SbcD|nr:exonuclease SbcCD subunit D [Clostridiales bacterium]
MKFLHLSDLHIGKSVNGFSMLEEQRHAFRQILGYIEAERPDAAVVAGDVYDRAVPGVEAVRLFDDFLTELSGASVSLLLVSGNHDSPERLNYASRLLSDKNIYICGAFDGELKSVALPDEYGEVRFWLLPFIKPSSARAFFGGRGVESYDDALSAALQSANIDYAARNVLIAHQFFTPARAQPLRSESELSPAGGIDAVSAELISRFDYAALGHLHGAQSVGADNLRYAGSPVKYSLSERRQEKSVTLAELRKKGDLTFAKLPLTPIHDMREIKGELDKLTSREISELADKEDYLRVILTDERELADPMGRLRSVYPNVMALDFENSRTRADISETAGGREQAEALSPYDLFSEFFLEVSGAAMSAEQAEIARELLESAAEAAE